MVDELIRNGLVKVKDVVQNVAYTLNNENLFLMTGYKVMKSKERSGFAKCEKLTYNGKIQLLYFTADLKPVSSVLPTIDGDAFLSVIAGIMQSVIDTKNNGFLMCQNFDLSFDRIFVDINTLNVYLIYLPLNVQQTDMPTFERMFRMHLIKLITTTMPVLSVTAESICAGLSNGALSLENIYMHICANCQLLNRRNSASSNGSGDSNQQRLTLTSVNTANQVRFEVNKQEFVIGRNPGETDGTITFDRAVGRVHCKLTYQNGEYFIVDLGSANGTYVNRTRIEPFRLCPLKAGDALRIADIDFSVKM